MKLITDTDYCPVRNFDNVCSLCNCECISGEALTRDCPLIRNGGTPLPKGHDRLVEAGAVIKALFGKQTIDDVPTIVEADKESNNETDN